MTVRSESRHEQQHAPVDGNLFRAGQLIRQQGGGSLQASLRQQQADGAACQRQQERLDEQLLKYARPSRSERSPNRDLLAAREHTREEQVADVRAGDEQHQARARSITANPDVPTMSSAAGDRGSPSGVLMGTRAQLVGYFTPIVLSRRNVPQARDDLRVVILGTAREHRCSERHPVSGRHPQA